MCFAFVHYIQMTHKRATDGEEEPGEKCYIMQLSAANATMKVQHRGQKKRETGQVCVYYCSTY